LAKRLTLSKLVLNSFIGIFKQEFVRNNQSEDIVKVPPMTERLCKKR